MNIIRGDTKKLRFKRIRKSDCSVITELPDKLFFTVKYSTDTDEVLIQKTLENNGIKYNEKDNYYYIVIEPEETDNLPYVNLVYDIERIIGANKKTIAYGTINVTDEVTFVSNEE